MNYAELYTYLTTLLQINTENSTDFDSILPLGILDGEGRIYREMDFLAASVLDATASFTPNNRNLTLPATIIICQGISAITPAATTPANGVRHALEPVTLDFLDYIWNKELGTGSTGVPQYFTMQSATIAMVAPTPDAAYVAEVNGIIRPAPISVSNPTTYISLTYPDLLVAAIMVFLTGYQRDWGAQSDDPKMAMSWESHYQAAKQFVMVEEQRRKFQGPGWNAYPPSPLTTTQRT